MSPSRHSSTQAWREWEDVPPMRNFDCPYPPSRSSTLSHAPLLEKYSLHADPTRWGANLYRGVPEPDDAVHDPDEIMPAWKTGHRVSVKTLVNTTCLLAIILGLLGLFIGVPITLSFTKPWTTLGAFNLGGINATGQIPSIAGNWGLIDKDTPQEAYTIPSWNDGQDMQLVFSDEFNTDGRSFYPGDDPYWEAADLHYWATKNLEWYDPSAVTTANGSLVITLDRRETHGLNYQGGFVSTWNKFCFTGGYIEASVQLPGLNNVVGYWPALWTMGNLGRAGYGATTEGLWPYSYDSCDVGTVSNQSVNGVPRAALTTGVESADGALSYLPGQRLSRCTCPGESHPGPKHADGTFVGRAAPEIDIFEAQIENTELFGEVSQSAQWAPFNAGFEWANTSANMIIQNPSISQLNPFVGTPLQQATSVVTTTDQDCYELEGGCFAVYGFEYRPGFDDGYISWVSTGQLAWTLKGPGLGPDSRVEIGARPVPQEPMYIIANLGLSPGFGPIDEDHLRFPARMSIDYIRVYQPKDAINIGCDPPGFPTSDYINKYIDAYTNPNFTTWHDDFRQPVPRNSFLGQCD